VAKQEQTTCSVKAREDNLIFVKARADNLITKSRLLIPFSIIIAVALALTQQVVCSCFDRASCLLLLWHRANYLLLLSHNR
jgi:hypothetical protein